MSSTHVVLPLPLAGNTTADQNRQLQEFLGAAAKEAYVRAIEQLDRQAAESVIESSHKLKEEISETVLAAIQHHTVSNKYRDEEAGSQRVYPLNYRIRSIEAQVTELKKVFPSLGSCHEKLARWPLLEGAEGWFAIPRWQAISTTYGEAVETLLDALGARRRVSNRLIGKLNDTYLRQTERSVLAESILAEQQQGNDIMVVAAQAGMLHRGFSARRTRAILAPNEFAMGVFGFAAMLLTHPERLSNAETLMVDCGGDEYSVRGDYTFDRVPLFDFEACIEFSIFYHDRARNLWGTPTGFTYKFS